MPVVTVEPAGDGVAAEVDDVAAETVELADEGLEDAVEVGGQLLGAALRAELGRRAPRSRVVKPEMSANSAAPWTRSGS